MDSIFVQGIAGFIAALGVFVGSIWLLLALVLGARLAYFVTASVTLGFILIMGVVWSVGTPLGPVGVLPEWELEGLGASAAETGFGPASDYPGGAWQVADPEDQAQTTKAAELEGDAVDALSEGIESGGVQDFETPDDAQPDKDLTRLLEIDGVEYGAVTFVQKPPPEPATGGGEEESTEPELREGEEEQAEADFGPESDAQVIVVMQYDPGNPLGKARIITAGTFLLFAAHLAGLRMSEGKARRRAEATA